MHLLSGFLGPGDTLYMRPAVRALLAKLDGPAALATCYPQFFHDMELNFWRRPTVLRIADHEYSRHPKGTFLPIHKRSPCHYDFSYNHKHFADGCTIAQGIGRNVKLELPPEARDMTLAPKPEWLDAARKIVGDAPFAIIRRATLRAEWRAVSRNPAPGLIDLAAQRARAKGLKLVSVGWIKDQEEIYAESNKIEMDQEFDHGGLNLETVFGLTYLSRITITPQGFALPMAMSARAPVFVVYGGYVNHRHLVDTIHSDLVGYVEPENQCGCFEIAHECKKDIPHDKLVATFDEFFDRTGLVRREG